MKDFRSEYHVLVGIPIANVDVFDCLKCRSSDLSLFFTAKHHGAPKVNSIPYLNFQCFAVASHVLRSSSVTNQVLIHLALMLRHDPSQQHSLRSNNSQQEKLIEQPSG